MAGKDITLEDVQKKLYSAELEERQMYHYWCDCSDRWTTEQCNEYQRRWDRVIERVRALKDLENAIKKAVEYL